MVIMGIDPGLNGGVAFVTDAGNLLHYQRMPTKPVLKDGKRDGSKRIIDIAQVAAMVARFEPTQVYVEQVHAMPAQGVTSTFTFGMMYGMILGLSYALEALMETRLVTPQRWQGFLYGKGYRQELEPKARALAKFSELWPGLVEENVTHDGVVDALLIAEYGRRQLALN